ncbi:hypothetical protein [Salipaludibacillus daqingensis]|nr:hypothetical protein [Salipaludibacillus daqingensis]
MKKRNKEKNAALTNNNTPDESLPDHQEKHQVSHNRELEKPHNKRK